MLNPELRGVLKDWKFDRISVRPDTRTRMQAEVTAVHLSNPLSSFPTFQATSNVLAALWVRERYLLNIQSYAANAVDYLDFKRAVVMYLTDDFTEPSGRFLGSSYDLIDWELITRLFEHAFDSQYEAKDQPIHYCVIQTRATAYDSKAFVVRAHRVPADINRYVDHYRNARTTEFVEQGTIPYTPDIRQVLSSGIGEYVRYAKKRPEGQYNRNDAWLVNVQMQIGNAYFTHSTPRWFYCGENEATP